MTEELVPIEVIENKIYIIRGQKVMLDRDLAVLYGVETKYLNRQVRRNILRFPEDFMFQLTEEEYLRCQKITANLRCQNVTSRFSEVTGNIGPQNVPASHGGHRYLPYAFTEQGLAMLSSVLNSERAILVNIAIMRAFLRLRQILATHKELAQKLNELEEKVGIHDDKISEIVDAIRQLMAPPKDEHKSIGFKPDSAK